MKCVGDKRIRTADPLLARQVLYQLSYTPINGRDAEIRTLDLSLPRRARYQTALHPDVKR